MGLNKEHVKAPLWVSHCCLLLVVGMADVFAQSTYVLHEGYAIPIVAQPEGPEDYCPDTPEGEEENEQGCSLSQLDSDKDGVSDALDICPVTNLGDEVDHQGCSAEQLEVLNGQDEDGDSVPDYLDQCAGTASGETVDEHGCAPDQIDSDGDGTPDYLDAYPLQNNSQCLP